jgi:hypothetical protein
MLLGQRNRPVALVPRCRRAGGAAALLEAADPGLTDGELGGGGAGRESAVAVGQDALAQVGGVGSHGIPSW